LFGLVVLTALSWVYLVRMAAMMNVSAADKGMHAAMGMPEMATSGAAEFVMLFLMWAVMMVAMMLPPAAPIILLCPASPAGRPLSGANPRRTRPRF